MVGTLHERRNKWCEDNGVDPSETTLVELFGEFRVPKGQPFTRDILEAIPDQEVLSWLFAVRVKSMTDAVQIHLDTTAQSWGYDNIISLCTYDGNSDPKYSAEGAAGKEWRSSVWRYCEDELVKISEGARAEPESNEEFIAELPTVTRP